MIKLISILALCLFYVTTAEAQIPPNAFNYSAVARGPQGQPIAGQNIAVRFSILKSNATGSVEYVEDHMVVTDPYGLFNLIIGGGMIQSGNFNAIDWSSDNYFLKIELDIQGGSNFYHMGTTQFISVPYALYAKSAGSISGGSSGSGFTHFIGEAFGGGVVFSVWKDQQGVEHGLIVDFKDLSKGHIWSNLSGSGAEIGQSARTSDGLKNSLAIISQPGHNSSAAQLCLDHSANGFNDWYLPSTTELAILWRNFYIINKTLLNVPDAEILEEANGSGTIKPYWSSSEMGQETAGVLYFHTSSSGSNIAGYKSTEYKVRAIRVF
ncbi:MAG: hypothetical protein U0V54_13535 [Saprospiraceae bacterium]